MAKLKLFSRSSTGTSASTVTSLAESTAPSATTRATSLGPDPCASCKTLNRKCNGGRPSCGYCQSESLQCDYGGESSSRRASQRTTTNSQHTPSELLDYRRPRVELKITEFPVAYFLDGNVFNRSEQRIPNADLTLPDYVRDLIPNAATVKNIASQYFATVHTYMPIISKGRFFTVLMNPLLQPRTDVGLLLLCMQLIILPPSDKVPMKMAPEYVAAKEFYTEIEAAGTCSIQVMQAGILIALYEFGHAIYPQAYFSVGACARYGVAYGMDDIYMDVPSSEDWVEEEERKRVWWAVLMLDRCMNMGKPIRALLTLEPHPSCTLPMDDDAWDNEVLDPEVFQLFSPSSANMGKFAQMAKATYLLGRVFAHACDAVTEESFGGEQAAELKTTLRALINLTDVEGPNREIENSAESAMCFSGLLILQECYGPLIGELSNTLKDVEHEIVNTGIDKGVAAEITKTSQAFMAESGHHIGTVSPFAFHALYASAAISMEAGRISGSEDDFKQGRIVTKFLKLLGRRWKSAGAYLELLERKETLYYS